MVEGGKETETEVEVALEIKKEKLEGFSQIVSHGTFPNGLMYMIMPKYGPSLKQLLRRSRFRRFSIKTSVQIGM